MAVLAGTTASPGRSCYGYFAVMVPIFLSAWSGWRSGCARARGSSPSAGLPDYVRAGWLSPPEVAALGTPRPPVQRPALGQRVAGEPGLRAMRAFQFDATRLALLRDRIAARARTPRPAEVRPERSPRSRRCWRRWRRIGRSSPAGTRYVPPARWDGQAVPRRRSRTGWPAVRRRRPAPAAGAGRCPCPACRRLPPRPGYHQVRRAPGRTGPGPACPTGLPTTGPPAGRRLQVEAGRVRLDPRAATACTSRSRSRM